MRIFVSHEGFREPFDVPADLTVEALKQMVKDTFLVQLSDDKHIRQYLDLTYGGATLQDSWALCDIAVRRGSIIQFLIKSEQRPVMFVFNAVTGETLPITGNRSFLHAPVANLKTVVSVLSGLPVSAFRLSTPAGVQLYDCNWLQDYSIEMGTVLRLDTWDGWVEFLQGCLQGRRHAVQSYLSDERPVMRFQLRVALFIAAWAGHLDLATWLLECGVHAGEPVKVHPYREWCEQTSHQDTGKCPIHIAAESNQLLILKLFITRNPMSLACRDPGGRDPLRIAIQHGHRDCARYLANKMCSVICLPNMSLPMRIYLQMKHWVSLGKKRAASKRCQYTSAPFITQLGSTLLVDGFNQPRMFSKPKKIETKSKAGMKTNVEQPIPPIRNSRSISTFISKTETLRLPTLQPAKSETKKKHCKKEKAAVYKDTFVLPPVCKENTSRPVFVGASLKSFCILHASLGSSHHCSQTARQNAVHCLTIARTFTEKPWLKQLNIARALVRKRVHSLT